MKIIVEYSPDFIDVFDNLPNLTTLEGSFEGEVRFIARLSDDPRATVFMAGQKEKIG